MLPPVAKPVPRHKVAPVDDQEIRLEFPAVTIAGVADKVTLGAGGGGGLLTVTDAESVDTEQPPVHWYSLIV